jgi:predicted PurR-regulated permease PerM
MENERNTDKLAGYIIKLGGLALILALCWYFKNVLIYIIVAFVISMIGKPFMQLLKKIRIKGKSAPNWLLAIITILIISGLLVLLITQMIPLVSNIVRDASAISDNAHFTSNPIDKVNEWIIGLFPNVGPDFDITAVVLGKLKELVSFNQVSGIVGSVASMVIDVVVATFSVVFIAFFFIKEDGLFERIVCALVPDRHEMTLRKTLSEIKQLLSRYFVGLVIEM